MKKQYYSQEQYNEFLERAIRFLKENPNTSRAKVALYAGVGISVLERFEKEGKLKLPQVLTKMQARARSNWATTLGQLSGRRG